jgi:hypothetical protein
MIMIVMTMGMMMIMTTMATVVMSVMMITAVVMMRMMIMEAQPAAAVTVAAATSPATKLTQLGAETDLSITAHRSCGNASAAANCSAERRRR